ncbi:MAG: RidA family protein [Candidatus Hodarchaeales archaeon]|jgi:2-iminobutanoate/2-iminopropanoate deaminase
MMEKTVINVGKVVGPYSPAVIVTGGRKLIFVSGQIATDLEADTKIQTSQIIRKIEKILESADVYLSDIVKTTVYLEDIDDFEEFNEEYAKFFPGVPPARATIQAGSLPLNARVLIDCIAVRD